MKMVLEWANFPKKKAEIIEYKNREYYFVVENRDELGRDYRLVFLLLMVVSTMFYKMRSFMFLLGLQLRLLFTPLKQTIGNL